MTPEISMREEDRTIVESILDASLPKSASVWIFGSRARGTKKRAADLDLAIDAERPLTLDERDELAIAFAESDLPYTVDVVDMRTIGATFSRIVEAERVPFPYARASAR